MTSHGMGTSFKETNDPKVSTIIYQPLNFKEFSDSEKTKLPDALRFLG